VVVENPLPPESVVPLMTPIALAPFVPSVATVLFWAGLVLCCWLLFLAVRAEVRERRASADERGVDPDDWDFTPDWDFPTPRGPEDLGYYTQEAIRRSRS
jgi:hypothetical protein